MAANFETRSYTIKLSGESEDDFLASFCPAGTTLEHQEGNTLLSNICTDQSGILGLIRYLHNMGYTILELKC
jgi:hypothetical protein